MRSPVIEHHLNELGIPWEYHESVAFSKVNIKKGRFNQARVHDTAVDNDLVRQYRDALRNGAKFPAIVAYDEDDEYVSIDGNHRIAAFEAASVKTLDIYEVLADPEDRLLLTFALNTTNGRPQSEDDRDLHAVTLVNRGVKREVIAQYLNISKRRVDEAVRLSLTQARANRLGKKSAWSKIATKSAKAELTVELKDDSVFAEFVALVSKFGLGRDAVRSIRNEIEAAASEQDRLQIVEEHGKRLEKERKRERGKRTLDHKNPRAMTNAHMEYLIQHAKDNVLEVVSSLTPAEKKEMADRKDRAISTLVEVGQILGH